MLLDSTAFHPDAFSLLICLKQSHLLTPASQPPFECFVLQAARLAQRQEQRRAQRCMTVAFAVQRTKRRLASAMGA
jgi:hypothetical protein